MKIVCHTCEGYGFIEETGFVSKKEILVKCPECEGFGWVTADPVDVETMVKAKQRVERVEMKNV